MADTLAYGAFMLGGLIAVGWVAYRLLWWMSPMGRWMLSIGAAILVLDWLATR